MRNNGMFWERFRTAYPIKATALSLIAAMGFLACGGREAALNHALDRSAVSYDSLPAKAPRPTKPAEKLHAAVTELDELLAVQARRDLSGTQAAKARDARERIDREVAALERQFAADRKKLKALGAKAALKRLGTIENRTARLATDLRAALAAVPADGSRATAPVAAATRRLAELSPKAPSQPLSTGIGFGTKDAGERPASLSAGITPAYGTPTETDMPSTLPRGAEPADLVETTETKVTPAIRSLAEELGRDPVRIYEYVRNTVRYEPYYGVRKGADQTLASKSGSDADQAALMVALLRESGVHARFVHGVAELPVAQAANWLGVDTSTGERPEAAADILASGGIPTTQVRINGELARVKFNHVWAEAYVPSEAYRGADEQLGGKAWVPLDPSIKANTFERPVADFGELLQPAFERYAESVLGNSELIGEDALVSAPTAQTVASAQALRDDVQDVLEDEGLSGEVKAADVVGRVKVKAVEQTYLPASTPFRERAVLSELRALPQSLHASVTVEVSGADPMARAGYDPEEEGQAGFRYAARTADLAAKRITVGYAPASEGDAEIVDAYHGLLNAPTYVASLIPVLRVDGKVVARGRQAVSTGYTQNLTLTYRMPGFASDVVENPVYVGSLSAIALSLGEVSAAELEARVERLGEQPDATADNVLTDSRGGEFMSVLGSYYFAKNDRYDAMLAQASGIARARLLSGGIVASATGVSYIAGFPVSARFKGLQMDVDEDVQMVVSKTGDETVRNAYTRSSGMHASSSESAVFTASLGGTAVSTAEVMRDAMARGVPIFKIDAANVGRLAEMTDLPADVAEEIAQAVQDSGATVLVPRTETTIGGWTGVGYVIDEGSTLHYRISGGLNGGAMPIAMVTFATNFNDTLELLKCLGAINDQGDALNYLMSAATAFTAVSFSVVQTGAMLALAASVFWPLVAMVLVTLAMYLLLQAFSEGRECIGNNDG